MNCSGFTVINKENDKTYEVFDITYDKAGYPHFLIYKDGEWVRLSAKHFRPYTLSSLTDDELRKFVV
jgi:hypothetical protein